MLIGDKSRFAIEFNLDNNYGGTWLFGKFCYWVNNARLGNYDIGTSLRDVLFKSKYIIYDNGNRASQLLFNLKKEDLFNRLNCALYGDNSNYGKEGIEESWARFEIKIHVDVFDEWKIYLIENEISTRIIAKQDISNEINEIQLIPKEFDVIFSEVYNELNKLYDCEVDKERNSL